MTKSLDAEVRCLARIHEIPPRLVPAVAHRAEVARTAVIRQTGYGIYGAAVAGLALRIVERAEADLAKGVLEYRCEA